MSEDKKTIAELQKTILKMGEKQVEFEKWFTAHITALQKSEAKRKADYLKIKKELELLKRQARN